MGRILVRKYAAIVGLLAACLTGCGDDLPPQNCDGVNNRDGYQEDVFEFEGRDMSSQADWDYLMLGWRGCSRLKEIVLWDSTIENFDALGRNSDVKEIGLVYLSGNDRLKNVNGFKNIRGSSSMEIDIGGNDKLTSLTGFSGITEAWSILLTPPLQIGDFSSLNSARFIMLHLHRAKFTIPPHLIEIEGLYATIYGVDAISSFLEFTDQLNNVNTISVACFLEQGQTSFYSEKISSMAQRFNLQISTCEVPNLDRYVAFNGCGSFDENPASYKYYLTGTIDDSTSSERPLFEQEYIDLLPDCPQE